MSIGGAVKHKSRPTLLGTRDQTIVSTYSCLLAARSIAGVIKP